LFFPQLGIPECRADVAVTQNALYDFYPLTLGDQLAAARVP
jgi:hypothetical protein